MADFSGGPAPADAPGADLPAEREFAEQARAAGLVLPRPTRPNRWLSVVVVVVVVASALGLGLLTGWTDLRGAGGTATPILYGPANCGAVPLPLSGAYDPLLDAGVVGWLSATAERIINNTGGCLQFGLKESPVAGSESELSDRAAEFVVASNVPNASIRAGFPSPVDFLPLAVGAVAVVYNLAGVGEGLNLSAGVLAGIYSGSITSWDAPQITALNPTLLTSSPRPITVVYRSDASFANEEFSHYLALGNATWSARYGSGPSVAWPVGDAANGSVSLLDRVAGTAGAIGYVQLASPSLAGVSVAALENPDGQYLMPNASGVAAAAAADQGVTAVTARDWTNLSLVDAPGAASYPMAALTYLGLYHDLGVAYGGHLTLTNATWLMTVLWWLSESVAFSPLPPTFASGAQSVLTNVTFDGHVILQVQDSEGGEPGGETGEF
jgi:phosphate transport system substrate-binding protein